MKFSLRFLKNLFGIYALIIFCLSLIVTGICYFLVFTFASKEKAPHIAHQKISRNWAGFLFPVFGLRVKIKNKELLDPKQTYIFVANHRSQLDIPAYALACEHTIRFLAKEELTKLPLMGYIIRRLY